MKKKLLIIEDEISLAKQLKWGLSDIYEVIIAGTVEQSLHLLASGAFQVVTLDLGLPPSPDTPREGFRLLEAVSSLALNIKVIVITGNAETDNAMKAIALGAFDFCSKPVELDVLKIILERTFKIYELEEANRQLQLLNKDSCSLCGIISISPDMDECLNLIRQVSNTDYPVLIQGESGTGKEMAANAIHLLSKRAKYPFVIINCGAIPENLLESELFGHEKGAFTGASARKTGRFEQAEKGTIFLDEIGDMPLLLQVKILRFLQEKTIERVGGNQTIYLNVRIIAATHVNLEEAVKTGRFREDLFYRLNVVPIRLPPLRERKEDILLLAHHFIRNEAQRLKKGKVTLSQAAADVLISHSWSGNIRELQNRICRALATNISGLIIPDDLGLSQVSEDNKKPLLLSLKEAREMAEKEMVQRALAITGNNITHAAKLLGISRPTLHDLLKKHEISI